MRREPNPWAECPWEREARRPVFLCPDCDQAEVEIEGERCGECAEDAARPVTLDDTMEESNG